MPNWSKDKTPDDTGRFKLSEDKTYGIQKESCKTQSPDKKFEQEKKQ